MTPSNFWSTILSRPNTSPLSPPPLPPEAPATPPPTHSNPSLWALKLSLHSTTLAQQLTQTSSAIDRLTALAQSAVKEKQDRTGPSLSSVLRLTSVVSGIGKALESLQDSVLRQEKTVRERDAVLQRIVDGQEAWRGMLQRLVDVQGEILQELKRQRDVTGSCETKSTPTCGKRRTLHEDFSEEEKEGEEGEGEVVVMVSAEDFKPAEGKRRRLLDSQSDLSDWEW